MRQVSYYRILAIAVTGRRSYLGVASWIVSAFRLAVWSVGLLGIACGCCLGQPSNPKLANSNTVFLEAPSNLKLTTPDRFKSFRLKLPPEYRIVAPPSSTQLVQLGPSRSRKLLGPKLLNSTSLKGTSGTLGAASLFRTSVPVWAASARCRTVDVWLPSKDVTKTPSANDPNASVTLRITPPLSGEAGDCTVWKYHYGVRPKKRRKSDKKIVRQVSNHPIPLPLFPNFGVGLVGINAVICDAREGVITSGRLFLIGEISAKLRPVVHSHDISVERNSINLDEPFATLPSIKFSLPERVRSIGKVIVHSYRYIVVPIHRENRSRNRSPMGGKPFSNIGQVRNWSSPVNGIYEDMRAHFKSWRLANVLYSDRSNQRFVHHLADIVFINQYLYPRSFFYQDVVGLPLGGSRETVSINSAIMHFFPLPLGILNVDKGQPDNGESRQSGYGSVVLVNKTPSPTPTTVDPAEDCYSRPHPWVALCCGLAALVSLGIASGLWGAVEKSRSDQMRVVFILLGIGALGISYWFVYHGMGLLEFKVSPCALLALPFSLSRFFTH